MEDTRANERDDYDKAADLYDPKTFLEIVNAVQGHPLAALNAVKYIIRVQSQYKEATAGRKFLEMLGSNNYKAESIFSTGAPIHHRSRTHFRCLKGGSPNLTTWRGH